MMNDSIAFSPVKKKLSWREEQQRLRLRGMSYKTQKKMMKPPKQAPNLKATCSCKYSCKALEDMKMKLFQSFHKLDLSSQGTYLMGLIEVIPVQRRRHGSYADPSESRRQSTVNYLLPDGKGELKRVCKQTFKETFGLQSDQKLATLVKKKKNGEIVFKDKRGGIKKFKYSLHDRQIVREHINSFPKDVSHYGRSKSDREYLSSDLNVTKLFEAFKEKYPASTIDVQFYRKVFRKDFNNLYFRKPRVDTCKICDLLSVQSRSPNLAEANKAKTSIKIHQMKSEKAFQAMKKDAIDSTLPESDTCNIVMDLQKVFSLPKLSHSDMYYCRQLSCYNFGIHISDTSDAIMCLWHEGDSGRGGNQIASCLLEAINKEKLNTNKKKLIVWSDNCGGQLKNRMLVCLYVFLTSTGLFDSIEHKFLLSGHSFSSADRDFAIIEKKAKTAKMEVVSDVKKVIESARSVRPFSVLEMSGRFFDFDVASKNYINTKQLKISKVTCMKLYRDKPGYVFHKTTYGGLEEFQKTWVIKKGVKIQDVISFELNKLEDKNEISDAKKKDLRTMIQFLSEENKAFYRELLGD